jgi:NTE family protein
MLMSRRLTAWFALLVLGVGAASAQERTSVGVALGGGGARGLAHVGILKVLEEEGIRVDVVTGTSMGSIVGGLYAVGYTAAQLESIVVSVDWEVIFDDRAPRTEIAVERKRYDGRYNLSLPVRDWTVSLPAGVIAGQRVGLLLAEATIPVHQVRDFARLPIPFACVAADLERGDAVTLDSGDLADAIRASMAIPTVFTPVTIGNRLLVDGGAVRNLPVQDARALGAGVVLAIDVSDSAVGREQLTDVLTIMNQSIGMGIERESQTQRALADLVVRPSMPGVTTLGFTDVRGIMEMGEEAMRRRMPELRALLASRGISPGAQRRPAAAVPETVMITAVRIEGGTELMRRTVESNLGFDVPGAVTPRDLRSAADRLYGLQTFEIVDYRLIPSDTGAVLSLRCRQGAENKVRVGARLDSYERASAVLGLLFENVGREQAFVTVDLRVGRDAGIEAAYAIPLGLSPGVGVRVEAGGMEFDRDAYSDDGAIRSLRTRTALAGFTLGSLFTRRLSVGGGIRGEWGSSKPLDEPDLAATSKRMAVADVFLWYDGRDRVPFPMRGATLAGVLERSLVTSGEISDMTRWFVSASGVLPVSPRVSLQGAAVFGLLAGDDPPPEYSFTLGGVRLPFAYPYMRLSRASVMGFRAYELSGRQIQMVQAGATYWISEMVMMGVQANAAAAVDAEVITPTRTQYQWGAGVTAGILTLLGPLQVAAMTGGANSFLLYASFGYDF